MKIKIRKFKIRELKINQALSIQLYLMLVLLPILILSQTSFGASSIFISSLKYINCLVFGWLVLSTLWLGKKVYHPYFLFLISMFTFLVSRVFLDVFGNNPQCDLSGYDAFDLRGVFSVATQIKVLLLLLISMLFGHLGALIAFKKTDRFDVERVWEYDEKWGRVGLFLFWVFLIPAFVYYGEQVRYLLDVGYKEQLALKISIFASSSIIFRLSDDIFHLGLILFLASKPSWKKLWLPLLIFFLMLLFRSILGARVTIFTQMLMLVTYLGYRNFIKTRYVVFIGIFLIMVSTVVSTYRTYSYYGRINDFQLKESVNVDFLADFFKTQSITLAVTSMGLEQESKGVISKDVLPFFYPVFYPFISIYAPIIGDESLIRKNNNSYYLADKLSVAVLGEQKVLEEGFGLGSSYILEFYFAFGMIGCAIGCFLFFYFFLSWIAKYINYTFYGMLILFCIPNFFYMSRAHPLNMVGVLIKPIILMLFVILIVELFQNVQRRIKRT